MIDATDLVLRRGRNLASDPFNILGTELPNLVHFDVTADANRSAFANQLFQTDMFQGSNRLKVIGRFAARRRASL